MKRNFERIALIAVAIATVGIMGLTVHFERQLSNQKAMFYQLQALRTSVNLYKAINRTNPPDLNALMFETYRFPGEDQSRRFLQSSTTNEKGEIVDPFDNPYIYDAATGWVQSSTEGYAYW